MDLKEFESNNRNLAISQVFTLDIDSVLNDKNRFIEYLNNSKYDMILLAVTDIINELKEVYPNKELFMENFVYKTFKTTTRNKKIVKYLFSKLEKHNSLDLNLQSDTYNIEHILPENTSHTKEWWDCISGKKQDELKYRIGNLVLLEANLNRQAGNKSYEAKKVIYKESHIKSVGYILKHFKNWNEDAIISRQKHLAKTVAELWRISELD